MDIFFTPLDKLHFPLLLQWLETPHVKKWWDPDVMYTQNLVQEKFGKHIHANPISSKQEKVTYAYIIKVNNEAIGYIQVYNAKVYTEENGVDLSFIKEAVCGVDLFIGNEQFLHKGLGSIIIEQFGLKLLAKHFNKCLVDPDKNNGIAIRSFQKAGFKIIPQLQTDKAIWMIKELNNLSNIE